VDQLSESSLGLHSLIIYPDLTTLREFYTYYIQKQIEEKNELVFVSPFYETTDSVRQNLSKGYKAIDVDKYERLEKKLLIMDSLDKYLGQKEKVPIARDMVSETNLTVGGVNGVKDESEWWAYNEQMIKLAENMGNLGLSILGDVGVFYYVGKTKELLEYESSLPKQFDTNLKGICLYNQRDFDSLSDEQKQEMVHHHSMAVRLAAH
jgi:hypothetical protein